VEQAAGCQVPVSFQSHGRPPPGYSLKSLPAPSPSTSRWPHEISTILCDRGMSVTPPMVGGMATWDDVSRIALALPETMERSSPNGLLEWRVRDKSFAWERPLRKGDLEALGDAAPDGPILAARVPDLGVKEALLADDPDVYFTTPHFNGYPAVLVRLERIGVPDMEELLVEAWLHRAPKRLAKEYLETPR